ncbi:1-acylglycerol-3-phosphate O-acyltransferase PNPLA3-like [Myotis daubentonii]|uniref:1-acylglycerol-3-phosphate O-acyltransferase PNPLA3-like n=1 Tax=Myotis daubentonii TaxID=98922 RepID=UPI0028733CE7|nr:1-acylglycerol-3-phosphate O-acyltransferase PNPLA3-like [Myotis daubentonii]
MPGSADRGPHIPPPGPRPAAALCDPERGWSVSFVGCGFLVFYHLGATRCLSERAPHLLRDARMIFGASAGALHGVTFLAGVPLDITLKFLTDLVESARSRTMSILHPSFNIVRSLREALHRHLPDNVHQLISGRMCISLTRVSDWENVLVSEFQSKDDVVDALVCSSFIPFFFGLIPPTFRGVRYVDGGFTDIRSCFDDKMTITVSPFLGEHDICPKVKSTNFLHMDVCSLSLRFCLENVHLINQVLFPPDVKVLGEMCLRGYLDAGRFLEEKGICDRPRPSPSVPSAAPEFLPFSWETASPEASPGAAAWQGRPEVAELLAHLRVSLRPWDESILETLSPKLIAGLSEALRPRGGCWSKICSFLPVKVMSYVMLPCTLPVESALAVAQRLVLWLPDIPADVRWLLSITSQVCSRGMTHLLPTSSRV